MGGVVKITDDLEGRVIRPYHPSMGVAHASGFGLEINSGERLSHRQFDYLDNGEGSDDFQDLVDTFSFVRARLAPHYPFRLDVEMSPFGWKDFFNNRNKLNVLFHRDGKNFGLYSRFGRGEDTDFCPQALAVRAFLSHIEVIINKSVDLRSYFGVFSARLQFLIGQNPMDQDQNDQVGRLLSEFIFRISADPAISDQDIFNFQKLVDEDLGDVIISNAWLSNQVVWVSRTAIHKRACRTAACVGNRSSTLLRRQY